MQVKRRIALEARRPLALFAAVAATVIGVDQAAKWLVRAVMQPAESVPLFDGVFHLTYVRNTGAAFGLLPGQRYLFVGISLTVAFAVTAFVVLTRSRALWLNTALALVVGGAVGNVIDRVLVGRVTDFLDFLLIDFPVFNVADSAIVIGVGMLILWMLFGSNRAEDQEDVAGMQL